MSCQFPQNTPLHGYRKGCRCQGCKAAKSISSKRRKRVPRHECVSCGNPVWLCGNRCPPCAGAAKAVPAIERLMQRIIINANECWIYQGYLNPAGYGMIDGGTQVFTHRLTYEHFVGPIPDGLVIDHLCRVPACCNPDHLEAVTQRENVRRGLALRALSPCGTRAAYSRGCRCEPCRAASAEYHRDLARRKREATA